MVSNGGVITDAVSSQKWPGEAKVHVSIVNWVNTPDMTPSEFTLDGEAATAINTSLRHDDPTAWTPQPLVANKNRCFEGASPKGSGFIIESSTAQALLTLRDADYSDVVRPYLVNRDIIEDPGQRHSRWAIDFAARPLEKCLPYKAALDILRRDVKPVRDNNPMKSRRERWWIFGSAAIEMRRACDVLPRYIAIGVTGKRLSLAWANQKTLASNLTNTVALDDDYSMGILLSKAHDAWARHRSSTLETRLRYTPTSVFETFPWPDPITPAQREAVAELSRAVVGRRQEICKAEDFGLTKLYNLVDDGGYTDLKKLHKQLDEAVAACYGWPKSAAQDSQEIVRRLTQFNKDITEGTRTYNPFGTAH